MGGIMSKRCVSEVLIVAEAHQIQFITRRVLFLKEK
jgi:hypothetical protein